MKKKIILIIIITLFSIPLFSQGYHSRGRNAYVYRNYEKARELFLKDIEVSDRGDSYYFLGEIEKIEKNYDKAIEYFKSAVTKKMTKKYMVNAYWNLIIFSEERNDLNSTVIYCKELWQKTGDSSAKNKINSITNRLLWTNNQDAVEKYNAGIEMQKKKKIPEAEQLFKEAVSLDRNFLAPRFELGMNAYKKGNESEAMYHLGEIASKIPFYYDIQLIVGDINFKNRNYRAAVNNFSNAIDFGFMGKSQLYDTLVKRGTCYFHISDLDRAEEDIKNAVNAINLRKNIDPVLVLSAIYIKKKNFDNALKTLARAESISRDNPFVLFQTGSIHYRNKDWKYVSYFDRLYETVDKENPDVINSYYRAFTILMNAHYEKKNYSKSLIIADTLNKHKKDYNALLVSARSNFYLGKIDKAVEIFESISLGNDDRLLLSISYARRGEKEKAKLLLKNLLYYPELKEKAMNDKYLKPIINSMETQKESGNTGSDNSNAEAGGTSRAE